MNKPKLNFNRVDLDKDLFQSAIRYTGRKLGFADVLVEKDYFCSLILAYLYAGDDRNLVFRGGTALNKIYAGFYRLSEDLDFSISTPADSTRAERSRLMEPFKKMFEVLPKVIPGLTLTEKITGRNNSLQYIGKIQYGSCLGSAPGTILIEIGIREPNLTAAEVRKAETALLNPTTGNSFVTAFSVPVLSLKEAYAEKLRALFCRREPAIRDLFDVKHMVGKKILSIDDEDLLSLTRVKIAVPGNEFFGMTPERISRLIEQVETELKPVLPDKAYEGFNIEESLEHAQEIEKLLRK
jgi:hypothetical protein